MTRKEQRGAWGLGGLAAMALSVVAWQQHQEARAAQHAPEPVQAAAWDRRLAEARTVDVNHAGVAELERLPGVGPALAQRIIVSREREGLFRDVDELQRVPGIGPNTLDTIQGYVRVE